MLYQLLVSVALSLTIIPIRSIKLPYITKKAKSKLYVDNVRSH